MRFVDLFAGLGGFHLGLSRIGHRCVFACEINDNLRALYQRNFGLLPLGDIRKIPTAAVPPHDILCAGFPCQPFSKAGEQEGLACPKWGDLFSHALRIVKFRRPNYIILENVPNLSRHRGGSTWAIMKEQLERLGYSVDVKTLSPHRFGIPQIRDRIFISGCRKSLSHFRWPQEDRNTVLSIRTVLSRNPKGAKKLPRRRQKALAAWQKFLRCFPRTEDLPTFPIWSMEFGATYPYVDVTPHSLGTKALAAYRGNYGCALGKLSAAQRISSLPPYARTQERRFPSWKIDFIRLNRQLYRRHKRWIDVWLPLIRPFAPSYQKLEWNCKGDRRSVWCHMIQFRASGIRIKRPTTAPALVAMTTTQVPIIGWEKRYMTPRECARLQSLQGLAHLPSAPTIAHKALGNSVNAKLVELIAINLIMQPALRDVAAKRSERHVSHAREVAADARIYA